MQMDSIIQNPLVSVIMPVYNAENTIKEAIDSILNQTYTNFELLIGFDGCTDESLNIAKSFGDYRIKIWTSNNNLGNNVTRNLLIENSLGDYLCYADADDISLPNRITEQVEFLQKQPHIFGVYSALEEFGNSTRKLYPPPNNQDYISAICFYKNRIFQPSMLLNLKVFKDYNLKYDPELENAGDYGVWLSAINQGLKFATLPQTLVKYRISNNQISSLKKVDRIEKLKKIMAQKMYYLGIKTFKKEDLDLAVNYLMGVTKNLSGPEYKTIIKIYIEIKKKLVSTYKLDKSSVRAAFFFYFIRVIIKERRFFDLFRYLFVILK